MAPAQTETRRSRVGSPAPRKPVQENCAGDENVHRGPAGVGNVQANPTQDIQKPAPIKQQPAPKAEEPAKEAVAAAPKQAGGLRHRVLVTLGVVFGMTLALAVAWLAGSGRALFPAGTADAIAAAVGAVRRILEGATAGGASVLRDLPPFVRSLPPTVAAAAVLGVLGLAVVATIIVVVVRRRRRRAGAAAEGAADVDGQPSKTGLRGVLAASWGRVRGAPKAIACISGKQLGRAAAAAKGLAASPRRLGATALGAARRLLRIGGEKTGAKTD